MNYTAGKPQASTGTHVPPGEYALRVIEATEDTSKGGNDMIKLKLRVLHDDGTEGPALFDYLVFQDSSLWKIDQFLKSAEQHPGEGVEIDLDVNQMIGWEVRGLLKVEDYKGNKNNKVESYLFEEEF